VFRFGAAPAWLTVISWRPMFQVYGEGPFHGNGQRFATMEEADASAQARYARWTMARDFRIDPSDEPVNYIRRDGQDVSITPLGASGRIES
jgi:hypothetical protein